MNDVLRELSAILEQRREADPGDSYVASLHHKGLNKILEKIGEESTEVILAARDREIGGDHDALVAAGRTVIRLTVEDGATLDLLVSEA